MKRWYFATTALLLSAVSVAQADYLIIRVILRTPPPPANNQGGGDGGNIGNPGGNIGIPGGNIGNPGGNIGVPGGNIGNPGGNLGIGGGPGPGPGGRLGMGGGPGPGPGVGMFGNLGMGGGPGPGPGPGGRLGMGGGPGPGGNLGMGGQPFPGGNIGMGGQPFPGGNIGMGGGPGPVGNLGIGGGPGPGGNLGIGGGPGPVPGGNLGMGGGPGQGNTGGNSGSSPLRPGDYVTAVVELEKFAQNVKVENVKDPIAVMFRHKWGRTALYSDNVEIQAKGVQIPTPLKQYETRKAKIDKDRARAPDHYLDLAEWCLTVGLIDKCKESMDIVEKLVNEAKDKKVIVPRVFTALEGYTKVKPILAAEISSQTKAKVWKEKLNYSNVVLSKHYALVHNSEDPQKDGVNRRLEALENTYQSFYLWFALHGKVMDVPKDRMVAILVSDANEFRKTRTAFDANDLVSDGFYAKQDNLAVFSPNRVDTASRDFEQVMRLLYKKFPSPEELLQGKFPRLSAGPGGLKSEDVARAQMLALVEQALREEAEIASATHEGTRQLVAESGLLPRSTSAPEWVRFGLASFFEMPKGPFPGTSANTVKAAFWSGVGGPNWAWKRYFEELQVNGDLSDEPYEILGDVVTDFLFARSKELGNRIRKRNPNIEIPEDASEVHRKALNEARTLSWALTYFMMHQHLDEFLKYLEILRNLPRDAELDEITLFGKFLEATGIAKESVDPNKLRGKFAQLFAFSKEWMQFMKSQRSPSVDLKLEEPSSGGSEPDPNGPKDGGFFPGGPGGPVGPGGPGSPVGPGGPGGGRPVGPGGPGGPGPVGPGGPGGGRPVGPGGP